MRDGILASVDVEPLTEALAKVAGEALAEVRGATRVDAIVMASAASRGDIVYSSDVVAGQAAPLFRLDSDVYRGKRPRQRVVGAVRAVYAMAQHPRGHPRACDQASGMASRLRDAWMIACPRMHVRPRRAQSAVTKASAGLTGTAMRRDMGRNAEGTNDEARNWLRPQSLVFTLLAEHLLNEPRAVFSGSFIEVLERVGVGEHATRSTLARMAERGLLERQRSGRKIYFRMTPRCIAILEDGRHRIWNVGALNTEPSGTWTLLTFSLPEAWGRKRYDLRARLRWAGFGALQNGVWMAPTHVDMTEIIETLELAGLVQVFHTRPAAPTDPGAVIRQTFDLDSLAQSYREFVRAWAKVGARDASDSLLLTLRLSTQWLRIIRVDPRVPVHLLPPDWPAVRAEHLFRRLHQEHRRASELIAAELLDTIPVETRRRRQRRGG